MRLGFLGSAPPAGHAAQPGRARAPQVLAQSVRVDDGRRPSAPWDLGCVWYRAPFSHKLREKLLCGSRSRTRTKSESDTAKTYSQLSLGALVLSVTFIEKVAAAKVSEAVDTPLLIAWCGWLAWKRVGRTGICWRAADTRSGSIGLRGTPGLGLPACLARLRSAHWLCRRWLSSLPRWMMDCIEFGVRAGAAQALIHTADAPAVPCISPKCRR